MSVQILIGDCRERMKELPDASVDSVVCDPPYHLTTPGSRRSNLEQPADKDLAAINAGAFRRLAKGFMGQEWDGGDVAFDPTTWAEVLRVLKPGGHMVAFSGTRTYHRMVCAIEDAGFEIRDQLAWVYGSGFPKSLDVSKQIDKRGGANISWFGPWLRAERERRGLGQRELCEMTGFHGAINRGGAVANWELGLNLPTVEQFNTLCRVLELPFTEIAEAEREVIERRGGNLLAVAPGQQNDRSATVLDITAPATESAKQWQGWGTALKPSWEPICLARKPLIGSVAANVLAHGTGALNIDGCRVDFVNEADRWNPEHHKQTNKGDGYCGINNGHVSAVPQGRWPANLCHDGSDEVLAGFPETGPGQSGGRSTGRVFAEGMAGFSSDRDRTGHDDDGGSAARFFYCAKATTEERGEGNGHPTVKPIALMRWLCRLVTPKGGTVLDPFMGSGSTGLAADAEQFDFIGCELSPEYAATAERRIRDAAGMFAEVKAA